MARFSVLCLVVLVALFGGAVRHLGAAGETILGWLERPDADPAPLRLGAREVGRPQEADRVLRLALVVIPPAGAGAEVVDAVDVHAVEERAFEVELAFTSREFQVGYVGGERSSADPLPAGYRAVSLELPLRGRVHAEVEGLDLLTLEPGQLEYRERSDGWSSSGSRRFVIGSVAVARGTPFARADDGGLCGVLAVLLDPEEARESSADDPAFWRDRFAAALDVGDPGAPLEAAVEYARPLEVDRGLRILASEFTALGPAREAAGGALLLDDLPLAASARRRILEEDGGELRTSGNGASHRWELDVLTWIGLAEFEYGRSARLVERWALRALRAGSDPKLLRRARRYVADEGREDQQAFVLSADRHARTETGRVEWAELRRELRSGGSRAPFSEPAMSWIFVALAALALLAVLGAAVHRRAEPPTMGQAGVFWIAIAMKMGGEPGLGPVILLPVWGIYVLRLWLSPVRTGLGGAFHGFALLAIGALTVFDSTSVVRAGLVDDPDRLRRAFELLGWLWLGRIVVADTDWRSPNLFTFFVAMSVAVFALEATSLSTQWGLPTEVMRDAAVICAVVFFFRGKESTSLAEAPDPDTDAGAEPEPAAA